MTGVGLRLNLRQADNRYGLENDGETTLGRQQFSVGRMFFIDLFQRPRK